MMFRPISLEEFRSLPIAENKYNTRNLRILDKFISSEQDVLEIVDWKQRWKNGKTAQTSLHNSAKRFGYAVDACIRRDRLFLIKRDVNHA